MMRAIAGALVSMMLVGAVAWADEVSAKTDVPIKVQVVFKESRAQQKESVLPYTLFGKTNGKDFQLRMGSEVPISIGGAMNYKNVGTDIDCSVEIMEDGRYSLRTTLERSSVQDSGDRSETSHPVFRHFKTSITTVLRDGQVAPVTVASDPVTGDVLKVEITLSVLK
jgi:hypothetical protein